MKKIFLMAAVVITAFVLFSCGGTNKIANNSLNQARQGSASDTFITQSLFDEKDRTITEENIQRLLNGKLVLPDTVRIAIHQYSRSPINRYYYNYWSDEDFLKTQQAFVNVIVNSIAKSHRVKKIILIPGMMITSKPTITTLRETAVRLQSDLLLVFSITSDIYYKYRFLNKDEAKAYATTEFMLLDTRTGLVPYAQIVTKDFLTKKTDEDINLEELRKRAEKTAIIQSLLDSGDRLKEFLDVK